MLNTALGVIIVLAALGLIGVGPLLLLSKGRRGEGVLLMAPAFGFVLTTVSTTWIVKAGVPVEKWAVLYLLLAAAASVSMMAWMRSRRPLSVDRRFVALVAVGLASTASIVLAPVAVGGKHFVILRGNGVDSFNYVAGAHYLARDSYQWAGRADVQSLIDRQPTYYTAHELLGDRWPTFALLAWTSHIANVPIHEFDYGFTLLCMLVGFGVVVHIAYQLTGHLVLALTAAFVVCAGFWAQFVLDLRAVSQVASMPVLLLAIACLTRLEKASDALALKGYGVLALSVGALALLYVEILPLLLGGVFCLGVIQWRKGHTDTRYGLKPVVSIMAGLLLVPSLAPHLVDFFRYQVSNAFLSTNDWHQGYFNWLYTNPVTGVWGLSPLLVIQPPGPSAPSFVTAAASVLGYILSAAWMLSLRKALSKTAGSQPETVVAVFALVALGEFLILFAWGQWWAAAKALSYGYPFFTLSILPVGDGPGDPQAQSRPRSQPVIQAASRVIRVAVYGWLLIQSFLGIFRVVLVSAAQDYPTPSYLEHHGDYKQHDWDTRAFLNALDQRPQSVTWVAAANKWLREYLTFDLGLRSRLIWLDGVVDRADTLVGYQTLDRLPDYVLVDKRGYWPENAGPQIVAENSELLLLNTPAEMWRAPRLIRLLNPNSLEIDPAGEPFFWIGGDETTLLVWSPVSRTGTLTLRAAPGPSLPQKLDRALRLVYEGGAAIDILVTQYPDVVFNFHLEKGINRLGLLALDAPTLSTLPNGDTRPLLLRIYSVLVSLAPE